MQTTHFCPLCRADTETVLWHDDLLRVIRVPDKDYPGFLRVIWRAHVAEMSDLGPRDRAHLMAVVMAVEESLRERMRPDKINLASFGNMVPHLHWHVIARFREDRHYPQPVWGTPQREGQLPALGVPTDEELRAGLRRALKRAFES